jgi:hypothetical protein
MLVAFGGDIPIITVTGVCEHDRCMCGRIQDMARVVGVSRRATDRQRACADGCARM